MGKGDPEVTTLPTQNPQQLAMFREISNLMMPIIRQTQLGGGYGGPQESSYNTMAGEAKGGGGSWILEAYY